MGIVLRGKRLVAALVYTAVPNATAVFHPSAHVGDGQLLHEAGEVAILRRLHHQVPMVGHDAKAEDGHGSVLLRLGQDTDERREIVFVVEEISASGGAVEDMVDDSAGSMTCLSWHRA